MIKTKLLLKSYKKKDLNKTLKKLIRLNKLFKKEIQLLKIKKLPQKKKIFIVLKSPHVNKKAREHFIYKTYKHFFILKINFSIRILFNFLIFSKKLLQTENLKINIKITKKLV